MTSSWNLLWVFLGLCLCQCASPQWDDFREEGSALSKALLHELKGIQSRDDAVRASSRVTTLFNRLTDEMIAAREFQEQHPLESTDEISEEREELNASLANELSRVYGIPGVRDILERSQQDALHKLDAFERQLALRHLRSASG